MNDIPAGMMTPDGSGQPLPEEDTEGLPEQARPPHGVKVPDVDREYQRILAKSQQPLGEVPQELQPKND